MYCRGMIYMFWPHLPKSILRGEGVLILRWFYLRLFSAYSKELCSINRHAMVDIVHWHTMLIVVILSKMFHLTLYVVIYKSDLHQKFSNAISLQFVWTEMNACMVTSTTNSYNKFWVAVSSRQHCPTKFEGLVKESF